MMFRIDIKKNIIVQHKEWVALSYTLQYRWQCACNTWKHVFTSLLYVFCVF